MKCWYCGEEVVWDTDGNYEDIFADGEGLISFLHCPSCNAQCWFFVKD